MKKEIITITLRWPDKSMGLDISQITCALDGFLHSYVKKAFISAGSGRTIKIERKQIEKPTSRK